MIINNKNILFIINNLKIIIPKKLKCYYLLKITIKIYII